MSLSSQLADVALVIVAELCTSRLFDVADIAPLRPC